MPTLTEVRAERARKNLAVFAKQAWKVLEPGGELVWNWHLDLICEELMLVHMGETRRLIINIPPQSSKSRMVTIFFPVWSWISHPELRFMCVSYSGGGQGLSTDHSTQRRTLIESDWFRKTFPNAVKFAHDQNQKAQYQNTVGGRMMSTSTSGRATGYSADIIICDDLIDPKAADSEAARKAALRFLDGTLRTRLSSQVKGTMIIVEQRTHEQDTTGHAMKLEPGVWRHVKVQMEASEDHKVRLPISGREIVRRKGDLLWPQRVPREATKSLRVGMGSRAYESQYQQEPNPPGGTIIKEHWLRYWTTDPRKASLPGSRYRLAPEKFDDIIASWDCAFKDEKESSDVSGLVWAASGARRLLLDRRYGKMDFVETSSQIKIMHGEWSNKNGHHLSAVIVEDKANGPAIISSLRDIVPGLVPWPPKETRMSSKEARMFSVSPLFEAGNVELPDPEMPGYEWVVEFKDNLLKFPAKPNDDGDATSQALERLKESGDLAFLV